MEIRLLLGIAELRHISHTVVIHLRRDRVCGRGRVQAASGRVQAASGSHRARNGTDPWQGGVAASVGWSALVKPGQH
ncbi:hypothetical protein J6590_063004 [Homalodisca vitripennis]|nr:hypothetical protein J6590_063004 [Homalodisca vitripennis]